MTSVAPTEQAGSTLAGEGDRSSVTILKLRYALEHRPGVLATLLFGLQHVLIMFAAMIAPPLVIGQLLDLAADLRAAMLTGVMLGCGIGTIVSALGLGFVGARLPIVLAADGLGSAVAALFGGVPLISYDQNVGAISLTGVGSRFVVAAAGAILIFMALVPKVGALIAIVPPFVLGGTLIFMFAMIAAVGVGMLADCMKSQRDLLLLAASLGLAMGVGFAPPALFEALAPSVRVLAADGIVVGTATAVVLNLVLPGKD